METNNELAKQKVLESKKLIFIAASWKQRTLVRETANLLRSKGFDVYDFTDPSCRTQEEMPPEKFPEQYDPAKHHYSAYLNVDRWKACVEENRKAI